MRKEGYIDPFFFTPLWTYFRKKGLFNPESLSGEGDNIFLIHYFETFSINTTIVKSNSEYANFILRVNK